MRREAKLSKESFLLKRDMLDGFEMMMAFTKYYLYVVDDEATKHVGCYCPVIVVRRIHYY